MLLTDAYITSNDLPGAIGVLEKEKSLPGLAPGYLGRINLKLLGLYQRHADIDKAFSSLKEIDSAIVDTPDIVVFNTIAAQLGDDFLKKRDVVSALGCYRRVRDNDQLIALEKLQIVNLQKQIADDMTRIQADPLHSENLQAANKELATQIDAKQKTLTQYQTLPPILPPLLLRIGRAYTVGDEYWKAAVVFHELLRRYPDQPTSETALYGAIVCFDEVKAYERAQALCGDYETKYPQGKFADNVAFLRGVLAYDEENFDQAVSYFTECLAKQPNNSHREQIELILGDAHLRAGKFDAAITAYNKFQADFPKSSSLESAQYRAALALIFGGKSQEADAALRAYMTKYPSGKYVADAAYRLNVIQFGAKQYAKVLTDAEAWQKTYGKAAPLGDVLSLMGDCYGSTNRPDLALKAYIQSYKSAQTDQTISYSLFAAAKLLQKDQKWSESAQMLHDFIEANPDSAQLVECAVWIGRADIKLGKVEEARQFMADTAQKYLNDPTREGVDEILTQLAQMYARRHLSVPPAGLPVVASASVPTGAPAIAAVNPPAQASISASPQVPVGTTENPAQELESILTIPNLDKQPTAGARLLYAQSELARLQHKNDVDQQILLSIAAKFKPEDLSPAILGQVGDCLFQSGHLDEAATLYHELLDDYGTSNLVDYAYNGLGQVAVSQKKYAVADGYFAKALATGAASSKLKDITLGEAQTLLALGRYDEAKPLFEQVASTRAWRGEATALSVVSLGDIQMKQAKYAEANAFYQRVFVAYQKYPNIQAMAYLRSGEAFEKLGKVAEATSTYSEMLRNPNLASYPEASDARHRLDNLAAK